MFYMFLILLVTVSARDISQLHNNEERFDRPHGNPKYNFNSNNQRQNGFVNTNNHPQLNAPNNRQFVNNDRNDERPFVNPPLERDHRNRQESVHYHGNDDGQNRFVNVNNAEQFDMQNNREIIPNDNNRNDRSRPPPPQANQRHFQENLNNPEQFNAERNNDFIPNNNNNRNDRSRPPPPRQSNQRHFQENLNNPEQYNAERNREFIPNNNNNRNDRNWNPNTNPDGPHANFNNNEQNIAQNNRDIISNDNNRNYRPHAYPGFHDNAGTMSINLGFDRQGNQNRREQSNLNIPRQSFNINNEYSNGDDANNRSINRNNNRNDKYNENILHARRTQDEMTLGDYNRETQGKHRTPSENQNNSNGVVSFLNNLNNTNQNKDNQNPNRNNQRHQSGLKNHDTVYKPKTAIENEVTQNPLDHGKVEKENESSQEWVWGVEDTTTMSTVTIDDRAAFSGDKCAQGLVRFMGKCVPED